LRLVSAGSLFVRLLLRYGADAPTQDEGSVAAQILLRLIPSSGLLILSSSLPVCSS